MFDTPKKKSKFAIYKVCLPNKGKKFLQKRKGKKGGWGRGLTGADPIANTREPLGISRGFGIDEEAGLFAAVAE